MAYEDEYIPGEEENEEDKLNQQSTSAQDYQALVGTYEDKYPSNYWDATSYEPTQTQQSATQPKDTTQTQAATAQPQPAAQPQETATPPVNPIIQQALADPEFAKLYSNPEYKAKIDANPEIVTKYMGNTTPAKAGNYNGINYDPSKTYGMIGSKPGYVYSSSAKQLQHEYNQYAMKQNETLRSQGKQQLPLLKEDGYMGNQTIKALQDAGVPIKGASGLATGKEGSSVLAGKAREDKLKEIDSYGKSMDNHYRTQQPVETAKKASEETRNDNTGTEWNEPAAGFGTGNFAGKSTTKPGTIGNKAVSDSGTGGNGANAKFQAPPPITKGDDGSSLVGDLKALFGIGNKGVPDWSYGNKPETDSGTGGNGANATMPNGGRKYTGVGTKAQNPDRAERAALEEVASSPDDIAMQQQLAELESEWNNQQDRGEVFGTPRSESPTSGRHYEGVGNKAQNPEKTISITTERLPINYDAMADELFQADRNDWYQRPESTAAPERLPINYGAMTDQLNQMDRNDWYQRPETPAPPERLPINYEAMAGQLNQMDANDWYSPSQTYNSNYQAMLDRMQRQPIEYSDAFLKQQDQMDAYSPYASYNTPAQPEPTQPTRRPPTAEENAAMAARANAMAFADRIKAGFQEATGQTQPAIEQSSSNPYQEQFQREFASYKQQFPTYPDSAIMDMIIMNEEMNNGRSSYYNYLASIL